MYEAIKLSIKSKTSFFTVLLALTSVLSGYLDDIGSALFILISKNVVPLPLNIAINLTGIILGSIFSFLFLSKLISSTDFNILPSVGSDSASPPSIEDKSKTGNSPPLKITVAITAIPNFFFGMFLLQSMKFFLPYLFTPGLTVRFILAVVAFILSVLFLMVFLMASYLVVRNQTQLNGYADILVKALKFNFHRLSFFFSAFAMAFISLSISIMVYEGLEVFMQNTVMSSFLFVFYRDALVSCTIAALIIIYFKFIHFALLFTGANETSEAPSAKRNPLPSYIILLIFFAGTICTSLPSSSTLSGLINRQLSQMTSAAEKYRNEDKLFLCGNEYKNAYAVAQAYQGYLYSQELQKDTKLTNDAKKELSAKIDLSFKTAYDFWPNGGVLYYLDAIRQMESSPAASLTLLEKSIILAPDFDDSYFKLLDLYAKNTSVEKSKAIIEKMIRNGLYTKTTSSTNFSVGKISDYLEKNTSNEKLCMENMTTNAVYYYENQLYQEAMDELTRIQQVLPNDLAVNYLISVTDLEIKADGKPYKAAIEASQRILKQYPNESWAQEFATGIAMRAGNQSVMSASLKSSYEDNPNNFDIAEQYAYSILRQNTDFTYTEIAKQAEFVIDNILAKSNDRWFSLYCKAVIELFKRDYAGSLAHFTRFSEIIAPKTEMHMIYDDFYNLYVLKYAFLMTIDQNAKTVLSAQEASNPFLFNYMTGAFCWRSSNYDNGPKYLEKAIYLSPDLSKPYYLLGNIYFEKAGVFKLPEYYPMAEEQYRKALAIFPEDPYAWFSLGHVLKKTDRLQEAIGAFQKTLTYMPSEDHNTDHFGISIHSTYQIREISELLKKKEVK